MSVSSNDSGDLAHKSSELAISREKVKKEIRDVQTRSLHVQPSPKPVAWVSGKAEVYGDRAEAAAKAGLYARVADVLRLVDIEIDWRECKPSEFGEHIRDEHFSLDPVPINKFLNNGSYGSTPKAITKLRQQWEAEAQRNPVKFKFLDLGVRWGEAQAHLAKFVGADPNWVMENI